MKVQVKKLSNNQNQIQSKEVYKRPLSIRSRLFLSRWRSRLHDQIFSCKCYHMYCGHRLGIGKCDYDDCFCEQFEPIEIMFIFRILLDEEEEEEKIEQYKGGLF